MKDMKINENELGNVTGGAATGGDEIVQTKKSDCPVCKKETVFHLYMGGRAICDECGKEKFM